MEIDPFGFIEESCCIPNEQESILSECPFQQMDVVAGGRWEEEAEEEEGILRECPFPRKDGVGGGRGEEGEASQEMRCYSPPMDSTGIVMLSLTETEEGEEEDEEEEDEEDEEGESQLRCCSPLMESSGIVMMSLTETEERVEEEEEKLRELRCCSPHMESMVSLPETEERIEREGEGGGRVVDGSGTREEEEEEEEYHTPPENSSAASSSNEAAWVGLERAEDLVRDEEGDVSQDGLGLGKGGEEDKMIVLKQKLQKIRALRRKDRSPVSLRSKLRTALDLSRSFLDLDGGNVPGMGGDSELWILERGGALKGKNILDECFQEYVSKKLKNAENKLGIMSGNEHNDALDADLMETDCEVQEIRIPEGDNASGWLRRDCLLGKLESLEKAREDNVTGASSEESDGLLKRTTADDEFGGSLVDNSGERSKGLESSGDRDMVKDVATGNSEAVDLVDGLKESPVKRMKVLQVNMHVETPSDSVRIVKEKIGELVKSMDKLNQLERTAEGSSMRRKLNKSSYCEDALRIIDLEVLERHHGLIVDQDVENAASHGEAFAGKERSKNLAWESKEEIGKFRFTGKSFHLRNKGTRKCPSEVDEFEFCDNLAQKISKSRKGIDDAHANVLGESSKDARELRKLPPSIEGQSIDKESRKHYQPQAPSPRVDNPPQEDEDLAPSKSDALPPPRVKFPDLLRVMTMITVAARIDASDGTEYSLNVAKRFGMNLPQPRWWLERNFELG